MSAESAAWDGTKSAYNAVTGAYDWVAPNFTKSNQDLGQLVDAGEAAAKKANDQAAAQYADVPVLGTLVKASASLSNAMTDAVGGVVKALAISPPWAGMPSFIPSMPPSRWGRERSGSPNMCRLPLASTRR
jgi:hypothetical protein